MLAHPVQIAVQVAHALVEAGVPYLVGVSLASAQYGIPRSTQDVDLIADLQPNQIAPLIESLGSEFYIDAGMVREAVSNRSSFSVIHLETMYKVDVFVRPTSRWAQEEFSRRRSEAVGSEADAVALYFSSPEDTVLHKLDGYRKGGGFSDRQWNDVQGVLKVQAGMLDSGYLQHWANELGLADLLERAPTDAGVTL